MKFNNKITTLLTSTMVLSSLFTTPIVNATKVFADEDKDKKSESILKNKDVKDTLDKYNNVYNNGFSASGVVENKSKYDKDMQVFITYLTLKDGFYSGSTYSDLFNQNKQDDIKKAIKEFNDLKIGYKIDEDKVLGNGQFLEKLSQSKNPEDKKSKADQTGSAVPNDASSKIKQYDKMLEEESKKIATQLANNLVNAYGLSDKRNPGLEIGWDESGKDKSSKGDGAKNLFLTDKLTWPKTTVYAFYSPNDEKSADSKNMTNNNVNGSLLTNGQKDKLINSNVSYYDDLIVDNKKADENLINLLTDKVEDKIKKLLSNKEPDDVSKYLENMSLSDLFDNNETSDFKSILNSNTKWAKDKMPFTNVMGLSGNGLTNGPNMDILGKNQDVNTDDIDTYKNLAKQRTEFLDSASVTLNKGLKSDSNIKNASKFNEHCEKLVNKKANVKIDTKVLKEYKSKTKEQTKSLGLKSNNALITWNWIAPYSSYWKENNGKTLGSDKKIKLNDGLLTMKFGDSSKESTYPFTQNYFTNNGEMKDVLKSEEIKPLSIFKSASRDNKYAPEIALDGQPKTIISPNKDDMKDSLTMICPGFFDEHGENPDKFLQGTLMLPYYKSLKDGKAKDKIGSGNDVFGVDCYGDIINGQKSLVMIPYYQNPFLIDLNKIDIKANPMLNTPDSKYFEYGNGHSIPDEFNQTKEDLKQFGYGSGPVQALIDNNSQARKIVSGSDYIHYVNKQVGDGGSSKLSDKACASLAVLISSKTQKEVQDFNSTMLDMSKNNGELYLGKSDTKDKKPLNEKTGKGTYLYTATDIIQRAGLQSDVGFWGSLKKTLVGMLVDTYNSSFMKSGKQNIFQTKTDEFSVFDYGNMIYYMIVILLIASLFWTWIRQFIKKDSKVKFPTSYIMNIFKCVILVLILAIQPIFANMVVNYPGQVCIDAPLKRQSVLDQWNNIRQQQKIENPLYSALFNDGFQQINTSKSYIIKFYTTTLQNGKNPNKKSDEDLQNEKNKQKMADYNAKQQKLKEDNDSAKKINKANEEGAKNKVNLDPLQKIANNQEAQLKGNGSVALLAPYEYKSVNIASSDLLSWAIHMYRQIRTAENAKGFEKDQIGYEKPNGNYGPGETPLFVWLDKYYQPLGEDNNNNSSEKDNKDNLKDSLDGKDDTKKGHSDEKDSKDSNSKDSDDNSQSQGEAPEEEKVEEDNENLGITKAGQDAGNGDDAYGKRRNPADASLKSAYRTGIKNDQVNDNGSRYKGLSKQTEFAVNTRHYAKEYDKAFGIDSDSKNLANTEVTNNTTIDKAKKDNTMLTASQLFLRIFMTTYSRDGVTSASTKDKNDTSNSLTKEERTQGIENYNALMNFAEAFNGDIDNIADGNDTINSATIGTVGLTSLIDEVSMTKEQRIALNGSQQFSKAARDVMDAYHINKPTDDWLGLGLKNSPLDVIHPYFGTKQNQTRDGLIFKINKKFITDYIDTYSDVRAIIKPENSNSQGDNNNKNEDAFSMAEAHVLALNEFFLINKYTHQRMFPTGYQANTVSLDTWNRMLTIPIGEMKNKKDNSQYDTWDRYDMSKLALQDNTAEYIGINYSIALLAIFLIMTTLLLILGILMSAIIGFVMPIMSLFSLFKAFFTSKELKFKDILFGAIGTYLLFGLMKIGLIGIISILSNVMNNSYARTGEITDARIWTNVLTVTLVTVAELLIVIGYTMALIKNKATFGATQGQGLFKGVGSVFTNTFNRAPLLNKINNENIKSAPRKLGRLGWKGSKILVKKTTHGIGKVVTVKNIKTHHQNIKDRKEKFGNGYYLREIKNNIETIKFVQTLNKKKDAFKSKLSDFNHKRKISDTINNVLNAKYGSLEKTYSNGLYEDEINKAVNGDILSSKNNVGSFNIDLLNDDGLTTYELNDLIKKNNNLKRFIDRNGRLVFDGFNENDINNANKRKEMVDDFIKELQNSTNNIIDVIDKDKIIKNKILYGNINTEKNGTKEIKLNINGMNDKKFEEFNHTLDLNGFKIFDNGKNVQKDSNGNLVAQEITIIPKNKNTMQDKQFKNFFENGLQKIIKNKNISLNEKPTRFKAVLENANIAKEILEKSGINGKLSENEILINNENDKNELLDTISNMNKEKTNSYKTIQRLAQSASDFATEGIGHGFSNKDISFENKNKSITQFKTNNANNINDIINKSRDIVQNNTDNFRDVYTKILNNQNKLLNEFYKQYNGTFNFNEELLKSIQKNNINIPNEIKNQIGTLYNDAKNSGDFFNLNANTQKEYNRKLNNIIDELKNVGVWNKIENDLASNSSSNKIRELNQYNNQQRTNILNNFGKNNSKLNSLSTDKLMETIVTLSSVDSNVSNNNVLNVSSNNEMTDNSKSRISNLIKTIN